MNTRLTLVASLLTLATSPALAAGTLHVRMTPHALAIQGGETMVVHIEMNFWDVLGGNSIAGWRFDVLGNPNGTLAGNVDTDRYPLGNNGAQVGSDLLDYSGARLPDGSIWDGYWFRIGSVEFTDAGIATESYMVALAISDYVSPSGTINIYTGSGGGQSRSSLTSSTGINHLVEFDITPFQVIVPAPGSLAALGLASVFAGRRRRADS